MGKLPCSDEVHYGRGVQKGAPWGGVQCKSADLVCHMIRAGLLLCGSDPEPPVSRICLAGNG